MLQKKESESDDDRFVFSSSSETFILFVCSLIWPMVDSYYATLMFTLGMVKNKGVIEFS